MEHPMKKVIPSEDGTQYSGNMAGWHDGTPIKEKVRPSEDDTQYSGTRPGGTMEHPRRERGGTKERPQSFGQKAV